MTEKTENPKGYKKTKLGWIPDDWEILKFNEMFDFLSTGSNSREELNNTGEYLYIHYGDIHCIYNHILDCSKTLIPHINRDKVEKLPLLQDKDLIFVDASEDYKGITKCTEIKNIKNEKIVSGLHTILLRPKKNIASGFGGYISSIPMVNKNIKKMANGWKVYGISKENLSKITFVLPKYKEQEKIVEILSTWDEGIEILEKLVEQKELSRKSIIQKLFQEKVSWKLIRFDKIFKDFCQKNCPNEILLSATQENGVIPRGMLNGKVMSPEGSLENYKLIEEGDFVISLRSFQGGLEYSKYRGILSPAYTVLKNIIDIDKDFYRYFFKSYKFIEKYLSISVIGIRDGKQISYSDLSSVKIPYPPLNEQEKIGKILNCYDEEIHLLNTKLEKLKQQKKGLMQKLLTGQIRVKI